jgi:hypothetical protein
MNTEHIRYRLTLRSERNSVPAICRLRRLIKAMLRGYGFRVVLAEQLEPENPKPSPNQEGVNDGNEQV